MHIGKDVSIQIVHKPVMYIIYRWTAIVSMDCIISAA